MSYLPKRRSLLGLGDASSCGADQVWDPNVTYLGIKGQCMPRSSYTASQLVDPNAYPGIVKTAGSSSSSLASSILGTLLGGLLNKSTPAQTPVVVQQPSGVSTTTIAIVGAAALAAVLIATRD